MNNPDIEVLIGEETQNLVTASIMIDESPVVKELDIESDFGAIVNMHNQHSSAHKNLLDPIKQKLQTIEAAQENLAKKNEVPIKVSQLENDSNYLSDVSNKLNVSLNNLSNEGEDLIKGFIPAHYPTLTPFCVNSGIVDSTGNPALLRSSGSTVTAISPFTYTNAKGETKTQETDLNINVNQTSNIAINNGELELTGEIYRQKTQPSPATNFSNTGCAITKSSASGFSATSFITPNTPFVPGSNSWEINIKLTTGSSVVNQAIYANTNTGTFGILIHILSGKFSFNLSSSGSNWNIYDSKAINYTVLTNTTYWLKMNFTGTSYSMVYSLDGVTYTGDATINSTVSFYQNDNINRIGNQVNISVGNVPFLGSIDLANFNIKINGELMWSGYQAIKENSIWLNTSTEPLRALKFNGIAWLEGDFVPVGECIIENGGISKVSTYEYNTNKYFDKNSWQKFSPNYLNEASLAVGVLWTAPSNGWLRANNTGYLTPSYPVNKGEKFIPNSAGFKFYPCKGA